MTRKPNQSEAIEKINDKGKFLLDGLAAMANVAARQTLPEPWRLSGYRPKSTAEAGGDRQSRLRRAAVSGGTPSCTGIDALKTHIMRRGEGQLAPRHLTCRGAIIAPIKH